jgi:hypothetical protein
MGWKLISVLANGSPNVCLAIPGCFNLWVTAFTLLDLVGTHFDLVYPQDV